MSDTINEAFGKKLKELRESKGMRQEDVGDLFQMQKSTVSQWESGRLPHVTIITRLADYFNVTTDELLGRKVVKQGIISKDDPDPEVAQLLRDNGIVKLKLIKDVSVDELKTLLSFAMEIKKHKLAELNDKGGENSDK